MALLPKGGATGSQFDNHDALYAWAHDMYGGTLTGDTGDPTLMARRTMAAAGTTSIKTTFPIGQNWRAIAVRWAWAKEAAGSGNVIFRARHSLWYPLLGADVDGLTATSISISAQAVPSDPAGSSKYFTGSETAAILTPADGVFSSAGVINFTVDRLGDDAGDTYASAISLIVLTATRID